MTILLFLKGKIRKHEQNAYEMVKELIEKQGIKFKQGSTMSLVQITTNY